MTPTERAISEGHFFDPAQTQLREFTKDRPLVAQAGERSTDVQVGSQLTVENADGEALASASASDTATVTVERDGFDAAQYGSVGGSGELRIESD